MVKEEEGKEVDWNRLVEDRLDLIMEGRWDILIQQYIEEKDNVKDNKYENEDEGIKLKEDWKRKVKRFYKQVRDGSIGKALKILEAVGSVKVDKGIVEKMEQLLGVGDKEEEE